MKVLTMLFEKIQSLVASTKLLFLQPDPKQREAFGRVMHNLAVACIVGAVSLSYSTPLAGDSYVRRIIELVALAAVLLVVGGFWSKGE